MKQCPNCGTMLYPTDRASYLNDHAHGYCVSPALNPKTWPQMFAGVNQVCDVPAAPLEGEF